MTTTRAPAPAALGKLPAIGLLFWITKLLTTGMGEAASDWSANTPAGPAVAVPVALGLLALALRRQLRADRYRPVTYWAAVAMVAVFGTMAADAVHLAGVPYGVSTPLCALALAGVLLAWWRSEGTLSVHAVRTPRAERLYWATVLATFALGTAAGDLTAGSLGWGYLPSAGFFAALMALPALALWRTGLSRVAIFWTAYVLTRPLGASLADWLGKPAHETGVGLGDGLVALAATVVIVLLVGAQALAARERAVATGASEPVAATA